MFVLSLLTASAVLTAARHGHNHGHGEHLDIGTATREISYGMSGLSPLFSGLDCTLTCNGNPVDITPEAKTWGLYQCWGKTVVACEVDDEDRALSTRYSCSGAFSSVREQSDSGLATAVARPLAGQLKDSDHLEGFSPRGTHTRVKCVGVSTDENKTHASEGKDDNGTVGKIWVSTCRGTAVEEYGTSKEGTMAGGGVCYGGFVYGGGRKTFGSTASHAAARADATRRLRWLRKRARLYVAVAGQIVSNEPPRTTGNAERVERQLAAAEGSPATAPACPASASRAAAPPRCTYTCNGKPFALGGWWPCCGKSEVKCTGSAEQQGVDCFSLTSECIGFAIPRLSFCKGTAIFHQQTALSGGGDSNDEDTIAEVLTVATGFVKVQRGEKDGWKGMLVEGKGQNSFNYKVSPGKGGQATVNVLNIDAQLAVEE